MKPKASTSEAGIEDQLYEPERILKVRSNKGKKEYLIKWKGYDDPSDSSWEPHAHLDSYQGWLDDFERAQAAERKVERMKKRIQELTKGKAAAQAKAKADPRGKMKSPAPASNINGAKKRKVEEVEEVTNQQETAEVTPPPASPPLPDPSGEALIHSQELDNLKALLKSSDEKNTVLEATISTMKLDKAALDKDLSDRSAELAQCHATINDLTNELSSAHSSNKSITEKYDDLHAKFIELQTKCSNLDGDNWVSKQQLALLKGSLTESQRMFQDVINDNDQLAIKLSTLFTENSELNLKVKAMQREKQVVEEALTRKSEEFRSAHLRIDEMNVTIQRLRMNVVRLEESQSAKDSRIKELEGGRGIMKPAGETTTTPSKSLKEQGQNMMTSLNNIRLQMEQNIDLLKKCGEGGAQDN